jgi:hypothetical protein
MRNRLIAILGFTVVCIGSTSAADEPQLPPLKEGLWKVHMQRIVGQKKMEFSTLNCQSLETEKAARSQADQNSKDGNCTTTVTQQSANSATSEGHCDKGPNRGTVTKTTMTHDSDTSSHMEMHMTKGQTETVIIIDSLYAGSCPAEMKPGDIKPILQ